MIKEIAFVVYPVSDMARAQKFYKETLGLKTGDVLGESWIEYDVAGATFCITNAFKADGAAGSVAFEVDDLEKEVARLKQAGVPFEGDINESPVCRMALVKDPDGNVICIHKRNA